jgi:hypothetical protein
MTIIFHRAIRLVCLTGAATAPVIAALVCRSVSRIELEQVFPRSGTKPLPWASQTWVAGVADGSFPVVLMALFLSALIGGLGFYVLFSKRLSTDVVASAFPLICCFGYTTGAMFLASTMMGLVLPFLPVMPSE